MILALAALAVVVVEVGALATELATRRRHEPARSGSTVLTDAAQAARRLLRANDDGAEDAATRQRALDALVPVTWSTAMGATFAAFLDHLHGPGRDSRLAKDLADFDFGRQRRLGRTRLLVRLGPALGLMGTLIPLSPALDGLAKGDVQALTDNLRVAFSVTVLGLFVGAIAFGLSLIRERIYGQDYSDLEYVAAVLTDDDPGWDSA